jgi:hypothetical protein
VSRDSIVLSVSPRKQNKTAPCDYQIVSQFLLLNDPYRSKDQAGNKKTRAGRLTIAVPDISEVKAQEWGNAKKAGEIITNPKYLFPIALSTVTGSTLFCQKSNPILLFIASIDQTKYTQKRLSAESEPVQAHLKLSGKTCTTISAIQPCANLG